MPINPTKALQLRPTLDTDLPFLLSLYASTRAREFSTLNWTDEQKKFFIHSQFQLQHHYYQQQFHSAQFHVITANSQDVGRLYYCWENNDLRLIDIAVLPEYQYQPVAKVDCADVLDPVMPLRNSAAQSDFSTRLYHGLFPK